MRVTQTISIGTLRINSMSNSSIVQVGTSGAIKAKARETTEVIPQAEADQKLESQIVNSVKPLTDKEGIPTEQETQVDGAEGAIGGGDVTVGPKNGSSGVFSGGSNPGNENGKPDGMAEGDYNYGYGNGSRQGNRKNRT